MDQKMDYTPIESKPVILDADQTKEIKSRIYNYLGVTEPIVNSSYTEDQFAAFYESTIEPIALSLGLEFTNKIFNDREQAFGNSIMFESGRLQFTSNQTKVNLIKELMPYGLLSINQALEILNLPDVRERIRRKEYETGRIKGKVYSIKQRDTEIIKRYRVRSDRGVMRHRPERKQGRAGAL